MKIVLGLLSTVLLMSATLAQVQPPTAPHIDTKAKALLQENEKAMFALKAYSAECWTTLVHPPSEKRPQGLTVYEMSTLTALKPNRMRYDGWQMVKQDDGSLKKQTEDANLIFTNDGKKGFKQFGSVYKPDKFIEADAMHTILEPWNGFYATTLSHHFMLSYYEDQLKSLTLLRLEGKEIVEGVECDVVAYKYSAEYGGDRQDYDGKLYIGPDKLVRRKRESIQFGKRTGYTRDAVLRNIRTNFPAPPAITFAYTPPKGVTLAEETPSQEPPVLANGTAAPDFTVLDPSGKSVKLSDFRGKVVVLDFWATWCGPCMSALPGTNKVAKAYKDKGVVVLAVNVWDEPGNFKEWVPKHTEYDSILFLLDPNGQKEDIAKTSYKVTGIPTQYVIDARGIIRASFVGAGAEEDLEKAVQAAQK